MAEGGDRMAEGGDRMAVDCGIVGNISNLKWQPPEMSPKGIVHQSKIPGCLKSVKVTVKKIDKNDKTDESDDDDYSMVTCQKVKSKVTEPVKVQFLLKNQHIFCGLGFEIEIGQEVVDKTLQLTCSVSGKASAEEILRELLNEIEIKGKKVDIIELPFNLSQYTESVAEILEPEVLASERNVDIYHSEKSDQILLVGFSHSVKDVYRKVQPRISGIVKVQVTARKDVKREVYDVLRNIESNFLAKSKNTSKELDYNNLSAEKISSGVTELTLKKFEFQILKTFDFASSLNARYPKARLFLDEEKEKVIFDAGYSEGCQKMIREFLSKMKKTQKGVTEVCGQFLTEDTVRRYVDQQLKRSQHCCVWFVDENNIKVFGQTDKIVTESAHLIRNSVIEHPYGPEDSQRVMSLEDDLKNFSSVYEGRVRLTVQNNRVILVLTNDIAAEVIEKVAQYLTRVDLDSRTKQRSKKLSSLQWNIAQSFLEDLKRKFPGVQLNMDSLEIFDPEKNESDVIAFIDNIISTKQLIEIGEKAILLQHQENMDMVQEALRQQGFVCYFCVLDSEVELYSLLPQTDSFKKFNHVVTNCFDSHGFECDGQLAEFFKSDDLEKVLEKYKGKAFIEGIGTDDVALVATKDVLDSVLKDIESFKNKRENYSHGMDDSSLPVINMSQEIVSFIFSKKKEAIESIKKSFEVQICPTSGNTGISVTGNSKKTKEAKKELLNLVRSVSLAERLFDEHDIPVFIQTQEGKIKFEDSEHCLLFEEKVSKENPKPQMLAKMNDVVLTLVQGDIADANVDVVMCPVDRQFRPILTGQHIIDKGHVIREDLKRMDIPVGQVRITESNGNLVSPYVIHVIQHSMGSSSSSYNQQPDEKSQIEKAIKLVDSHEFYSIAIPVQLSAAVQKSSSFKKMLAGVNSKKGSLDNLREIHFYFENEEEKVQLKQLFMSTYRGTDVNVIDLEPLFEGKDDRIYKRCIVPNVEYGNLEKQKVDVLVNTTSRDLKLNGGMVSYTLLKAAGRTIQDQCDQNFPNGIKYGDIAHTSAGNLKPDIKHICHGALPHWCPTGNYSLLGFHTITRCDQNFPNGIKYGDIAHTTAGNLKPDIKHICHGALPHWCPTGNYSLLVMQLFMVKCLQFTDSKRLTSIAFPVLGTGHWGYPWTQVAKTMVDTVEDYSKRKRNSTIKEVKIVVYPEDKVAKQALDHCLRMKNWQQGSNYNEQDIPGKVIEARIPLPRLSVKLQIKPNASSRICESETRIKFVSAVDAHAPSLRNLKPDFVRRGIEIIPQQEQGHRFIDILTWEDGSEENFKKTMTQCLQVVFDNRASSVEVLTKTFFEKGKTFEVMQQASVIRSLIKNIEENMYLNNVFILTQTEEDFNKVAREIKAEEMEPQSNPGLMKQVKQKAKEMICSKPIQWRHVKVQPKKNVVKVTIVADTSKIESTLEKMMKHKTVSQKGTDDNEEVYSLVIQEIFTNISGEIHPSLVDSVHDKDVWKKELEDLVEFDRNNNTKFSTKALPKMIQASERLRKYTAPEFDEAHYDSSISRSPTDDSVEKSFLHIDNLKIDISEEQYLALNFFCKDENWMKDIKFEKDHITIVCCGDTEVKDLTKTVESKKSGFEMMNRHEVTLKDEEGNLIESAIKDVHADDAGVFCYQLEEDKGKVLRLMGHDYQTLQQAKHRIQIKLGQIKPSETRRHRRFETKPMNEPDNVDDEDDEDFRSSTRRQFSGHISTSSDQNASNFVTKEGLSIKVYTGSILHLDVDCIVNAANENLQHGGGIAMVIAKAAGYEFDRESRDYIDQNGPLTVGECCTTSAGHLKYKGVIHAVGPRWYDYPNDSFGCLDDLTAAVKEVMLECDRERFTSVAIPAISSGIFGVPKEYCTQQYYRAVTEYSNRDWKSSSSLKEVHFVDKDQGMVSLITSTFSSCCKKDGKMKLAASQNFGQMQVQGLGSQSFSSSRSNSSLHKYKRRISSDSEENQEEFATSGNYLRRSISKEKSFTESTTGKDENCCICMDEITDPKKLKCGHVFCRDCIDMQFQYKPVCPNCGAVHGKVIGDQPRGTMNVTTKRGSLEGYEGDGIIMIVYNFPAGVQGPDHPHPGTPYEAIYRAAYLPNNKRGKLVCKLLEIAFDRKLVFTIGRSRTTGKEGVVTWNDIHHKTRMDGGPQRFGYPDPTYLDRVMEELEVKGVTEESLNDP